MLAGLSPEGGPVMALTRGAADAGLLSAFGTLVFLVLIAPGLTPPGPVRRRLLGTVWASLAAAAVLALVWAAREALDLGGSLGAVGDVLGGTRFGHVVLTRLALLAVGAGALAIGWLWAATVLAGAAVVGQAWLEHAMAMYAGPSWLLASEVLHLLAAGAWLGGVLPLAILVASAPAEAGAVGARRFGPLGTVCVLCIVASAAFQSWVLVGSIAGLLGTAYGLVALLKAALLLALLGFAARNRFRLVPALERAVMGSRRRLVRSVAGEAVIGLLVLLAAGLLTSLAPAMHDQPVWPFPWQLSLETVSEDPDFLREVLLAGAQVAVALVVAGLTLALRWRLRWAVLILAVVAVGLAAPHFDLLFVPAWPTQFWTSPTGFSSASIVEGEALYPSHCAACHGTEGRGDGPVAKSLAVPPADLTAAHLWMHPDGELFWWLMAGIEGPEGGLAMPAFGRVLSEQQRWALIDWVRANNAGLARRASGDWAQPVQAPGLDLICADPAVAGLSDLSGQVVRIVFGRAAPVDGAVTVAVDAESRPQPGLCVAAPDPAAAAYAAVTGLNAADLAGTELVVDGAGWLRSLLLMPEAADDKTLAQMIAVAREPLAASAAASMAGMRM